MHLKPWVDDQGRTWKPYSIDVSSVDGNFSVYIMALSFEHAAARLSDVKENGVVGGEVVGVKESGNGDR